MNFIYVIFLKTEHWKRVYQKYSKKCLTIISLKDAVDFLFLLRKLLCFALTFNPN